MKENVIPFSKPRWSGSLFDKKKILFVGHYFCFDSLTAWLSSIGFSQSNLLYFLTYEDMQERSECINPDLVIIVKNRLDEDDESRWHVPGSVLTNNPHSYHDYSTKELGWLWNFWYRNHRFLKTKPCLEVEFLPGPPPAEGMLGCSECVRIRYRSGNILVRMAQTALGKIAGLFGKKQAFSLLGLREQDVHARCIIDFYASGESYGTFFERNEPFPFAVFENKPFLISKAA